MEASSSNQSTCGSCGDTDCTATRPQQNESAQESLHDLTPGLISREIVLQAIDVADRLRKRLRRLLRKVVADAALDCSV